jgi:hypothetical protein
MNCGAKLGTTIKTWSFDELRELCRKKGMSNEVISKFSIYANSLNLRFQRAEFHSDQAHNIFRELFSKSFSLGDKKYNVAKFSFEANVEACIQFLYAMVDILAQLINIVILDNSFSENDVSLKRIVKYMKKSSIAPEVLFELNRLINGDQFNYIESFCNTIKHRRLIKTEFRAEYGGNYRNEEGLLFCEFNYGNITNPKTWANDIIDNYRKDICSMINKIGLRINDFFR